MSGGEGTARKLFCPEVLGKVVTICQEEGRGREGGEEERIRKWNEKQQQIDKV